MRDAGIMNSLPASGAAKTIGEKELCICLYFIKEANGNETYLLAGVFLYNRNRGFTGYHAVVIRKKPCWMLGLNQGRPFHEVSPKFLHVKGANTILQKYPWSYEKSGKWNVKIIQHKLETHDQYETKMFRWAKISSLWLPWLFPGNKSSNAIWFRPWGAAWTPAMRRWVVDSWVSSTPLDKTRWNTDDN